MAEQQASRTVKARQVVAGDTIRWGREWLTVVGSVNTSAARRCINVRKADGSTESRMMDVNDDVTLAGQ